MKKIAVVCFVALLVLCCVLPVSAVAGRVKEPPPEPAAKHLIIVDADGNGDFTSIGDALASITDNALATPYLIRVHPGVYDVGATPITMKPYVDIEGSGENVTIITGTVLDPASNGSSGVVITETSTELRNLTIENKGSGLGAVALLIRGYATISNVTAIASGADNNFAVYNVGIPELKDVTAEAFGMVTIGYGSNYGIYTYYKPMFLENVKASATGGDYNHGLYCFRSFGNVVVIKNSEFTASGGRAAIAINTYDSSTELYGVRATASNGSMSNSGFDHYNYAYSAGTAKIHNSVLAGSPAIRNGSSAGNLFVGSTQVDGGIQTGANSNVSCAGVYDGNYTPYTCL